MSNNKKIKCPVHKNEMVEQKTKYGPRWVCIDPFCDIIKWGNSRPADNLTRQLRNECHKLFDVHWKEMISFVTRRDAYFWLGHEMGMEPKEAHIGNFNKDQCVRLLIAILKLDMELE